MASLYVATINARKFVVALLIFAVVVTLYDVVGNLLRRPALDLSGNALSLWEPVSRIFGDIDKAQIPQIEFGGNPTYSKESEHGEFPDVSKIYRIEVPTEKLQTFENAQKSVGVLGFQPASYEELGENNFEWIASNRTKTIKYNKVSQVWSLRTDFLNNIAAKEDKNILPLTQYANGARNLTNRLGFNTTGFENPKIDTRYALLGVDGVFVETPNQSEAEYVFVSLFRQLLQAEPKATNELTAEQRAGPLPVQQSGYVYQSDPRNGVLRYIVSNNVTNYLNDVFELDFINYEYSGLEIGVYQIITADEAWSKVVEGQGSLVSLIGEGDNYLAPFRNYNVTRFTMDSRSTELGFYQPEIYTGYVYPIFIFKGRATLEDGRLANFVYFIDAIKRLE